MAEFRNLSDDEKKSEPAIRLTREEEKALRDDMVAIKRMYEYRKEFEHEWLEAADRWNMLVHPTEDDNANFYVGIARMVTDTGITAMRQQLPDIGIIPGGIDDKKKVYFLKEANAHVDRMTNMEAVMDQFMVDYAVLGNGVLESYVKTPYTTSRKPIIDKNGKPTGKYREIIRRDWSRPRIGTRARSPWECAFDESARTGGEIRRCTWQEKISFNEFLEQYDRRPEGEYKNLKYVEPGIKYVVNEETLEREDTDGDKVAIDHYQDEVQDIYRIYANGVPIFDVPLSSLHAHGKITLSLVPNHHQYDKNRRTHALYGMGDPQLVADLEDLIQAATNMFIDNYRRKNTYVVGIENGGLDVSEYEFSGGEIVNGRVSVQSLGAADLPEWQVYKSEIEELAIQLGKKNYKRPEGESARTAFEIQQKLAAETRGMKYQIKKMESGGLLEHAKKRLSDIMEHMTVEEYEEITEEEVSRIKDMMGQELAPEDVILDPKTRKPIKVKVVEKFRTRGKVFEEEFKKGKRHVDGLREVVELNGQDGVVTAAKEYLWTREFTLHGGIPDVYLIGKTMLGEDNISEMAKGDRVIQNLSNIASIAPALKELGVDPAKFVEKTIEDVEWTREEIMEDDGDPRQKELEMIHDQLKQMTSPLSNGQTPDIRGPIAFGAGQENANAPLAAAA